MDRILNNSKKNKKVKTFVIKYAKVFFCCLTLCWTIFIFSFSFQTASESSELSGGLVTWLVEEVLPCASEEIDGLEHLVRKAAHFSEYAVLGVLAMVSAFQMKVKKRWLAALSYCIFAASVDETIQRFVEGRSGQVSDVLLDSGGALCGIVVVCMMAKLIRRILVKIKRES